MVAKKSKSKRQTLNIKYKIVKRVKQHDKRVKKGVLRKTRQKKINEQGIPSAWPYKEELLQEIQAAKDKMEMVKEQQRDKRAVEIVSTYHPLPSTSSLTVLGGACAHHIYFNV